MRVGRSPCFLASAGVFGFRCFFSSFTCPVIYYKVPSFPTESVRFWQVISKEERFSRFTSQFTAFLLVLCLLVFILGTAQPLSLTNLGLYGIKLNPPVWNVSRRHTLPCCAAQTLIIHSACEGWRVGWREWKGKMIWREMWSRMALDSCLLFATMLI